MVMNPSLINGSAPIGRLVGPRFVAVGNLGSFCMRTSSFLQYSVLQILNHNRALFHQIKNHCVYVVLTNNSLGFQLINDSIDKHARPIHIKLFISIMLRSCFVGGYLYVVY
jgi:hypothetical protein